MRKNFFDIVCLGTELPGLIAATLLAKQGYRTLLVGEVERPERPGKETAQQPAEPLFVHGEQGSPVLRWVFHHLNMTQEIRNRLEPLQPPYQVIFPRHRLDVGGNSPGTDAEVRRELPGHHEQLAHLLSRVGQTLDFFPKLLDPPPVYPPTCFSERRALRARLAALGSRDGGPPDPWAGLDRGNPLRLLFEAPLHFLTAGDPRTLGAQARSRLLGLSTLGFSLLSGGRAGLSELLLERFAASGGVRRDPREPEELRLPWRGPAQLSLGGKEEVGCRGILFNRPLGQLVPLLAPGRKRRQVEAAANEQQVGAYRVTFRVLLRAEVLPESMGKLLFLVEDPQAPLLEDNFLQLSVGGEGERRVLTCSTHLDACRLEQRGSALLGDLQQRLERRLSWFLPCFERHVLETSRLGEYNPLPLPVLAEHDLLRPPPAYLTPYRQILHNGHPALAGFGLEGEFWAAASLVQLLGQRFRRQNLLPR